MTIKENSNKFLEGERIYLRKIRLSDANKEYCAWMNDPRINQYLESRFRRHTLKSLKNDIVSITKDKRNYFYAIIIKKDNRHIGNIKLGPINSVHRNGDIGILIGAEDCWNKGFATEAIRLIVKFAFDFLNLHKVTAGCYAPNVGSFKAFAKVGFVQEGVRKSHCVFNGKYVDDILLGLINSKHKSTSISKE